MQNNGALWTIHPDAVAESLRVHILISSSIGCLEDNRDTDQYSISVQFGYLDVRARGGSGISDAVVDIATLLVMMIAIERNLIVIADVDCRMLARLKGSMRGGTYCRDVRVQYCGDPRAIEHQRLAWPRYPRHRRTQPQSRAR